MKVSSVLFVALVVSSIFSFSAQGQDQIDRLIVSSLTTNTRPGASVDLKGNYAILGGPGENGTQWDQPGEAYIFWRDTTSNWVQQAQIQASDAGIRDRFGSDVAIWDPYAIVVGSGSGSVYVFHRDGTNWTETQKISPTGGCTSVDIDMDNNVMVIGSPEEDSVALGSGAAYIYDLQTTWIQSARVKGASPQASSDFGDAVAIQGTNVLVGAWGYNTNDHETGIAVLFAFTSGNVWTQEYVFAVTDGVDTVYYAQDVALLDDQILIGAYNEGPYGGAYLYTRTNGTWEETAMLTDPLHDDVGRYVALGSFWMGVSSVGAPSPAVMVYRNGPGDPVRQIRYTDLRGASSYWTFYGDIAVDGFEMLIGRQDSRNTTNSGAFVYTVDPNNRQYRVEGTNDFVHSALGNSAAVAAGSNFVAAAYLPTWDTSGVVAVYAYQPTGQLWALQSEIAREPTNGSSELWKGFGTDVDMDGSTLVIGSPSDDNDTFDRVFVYQYDGMAWTQQVEITLAATQLFGTANAIADNWLAMGVPDWEPAGINYTKGEVLLWKHDGATWGYNSTLNQNPASLGDEFGKSVDLTTNYLIAGSGQFANEFRGEAWVFENQGGTWIQCAHLLPEIVMSNVFGAAVAINDEYAAVGAPGSSTTNGCVYVFRHQGTNWNQIQIISPEDPAEGDGFGQSVAMNSQFLLVGASDDGAFPNQRPGRAYLYQFNGTNVSLRANMWPGDPYTEYEYGLFVALSEEYGMAGTGDQPDAYVLHLPVIANSPVMNGVSISDGKLRMDVSELTPTALYLLESTEALMEEKWDKDDWIQPGTNWSGIIVPDKEYEILRIVAP